MIGFQSAATQSAGWWWNSSLEALGVFPVDEREGKKWKVLA